MKASLFFTFIAFAFSLPFNSLSAQIGRLALSPVQTIDQHIARTNVSIVYSRPAMRGRTIFGELVPYGERWRTGANRNTKVTFSEDVFIGKTRLTSGTYALFTLPSQEVWEVYFYTDTDNWDVPENWEQEKVAASISVPVQSIEKTYQSLTITLDNPTNEAIEIGVAWENTYVAIPVKLTTDEQLSPVIEDVLNGPDEDDYFLAAQYRLESGEQLDVALEWINTAIAMREIEAWYEYRIKALVLSGLGRRKEAIAAAQKGLSIAQAESHAYGTRTLGATLEKVSQ